MARFLLICAGGAFGTGARYLLTMWVTDRTGGGFPFGTLAVNVLGSFAMGFLFQYAAAHALGETTKLGLAAGVLGGFTTYSAFNQESLRLAESGAWAMAAGNVAATLVGCLAAGLAGMAAARAIG